MGGVESADMGRLQRKPLGLASVQVLSLAAPTEPQSREEYILE